MPALGQPAERHLDTCKEGDPAAAVAACTELFERGNLNEEDKVATYVNRGNAYDNLGDSERALEDYDNAIAIDPRAAAAHRNKGSTLNRQGRLREALQEFDVAISLAPDYALAYASRADNLRQQADSAAWQRRAQGLVGTGGSWTTTEPLRWGSAD